MCDTNDILAGRVPGWDFFHGVRDPPAAENAIEPGQFLFVETRLRRGKRFWAISRLDQFVLNETGTVG